MQLPRAKQSAMKTEDRRSSMYDPTAVGRQGSRSLSFDAAAGVVGDGLGQALEGTA